MAGPDETLTNFGAYLREARERHGLSIRDISVSTKISMTVLNALESNDVSQVPGGIFGRSFVRTYAEEVGLDPKKAVTAFLRAFPEKDGGPFGRGSADSEKGKGFAGKRTTSVAIWLVVASVLIVGLILFFATRGAAIV